MLRRTIVGLAVLIGLALFTGFFAEATLRPTERAPTSALPTAGGRTLLPVADSGSCAGSCQLHHDQCRVHTKGSPRCDAERQRCLELCLQKPRK